MDRVTFIKSEFKQETASTWLTSILQFASDIDFFKPFQGFKLKMKEVHYTVYQKLTTILSSIIMGCESTKDINEVLSPEILAANMLGMDHFPDQSQINIMLKRMDKESVEQLQNIHHELFMNYSSSVYSPDNIVIDIDQSGLVANAKSYEFAQKGYFPDKRGKVGYQVSAAFAGEHSEVVDFYFDPGNVHCQDRMDDLISSIVLKFKEQIKANKVIVRGDSGYGSIQNIEKLMSIKGLKFIIKGYSSKKATNIAKGVSFDLYEKADDAVWVYELPKEDGNFRSILVQILGTKGELSYTLLHTNIKESELSAVEAFHFYNSRQTIEAFFKIAKNTYGIKNLRTSSYYGIYSFIWLVFMAHNLISWFKVNKLKSSELYNVGIKTLVEKCSKIKGLVKRTSDGIIVIMDPLSKLAKLLLKALSKPDYGQ